MRIDIRPRRKNAPRPAEKAAPGFVYRGGSIPGDTEALFWAKVEKTPGCWLWLGHKAPTGYGTHWAAGRHVRAHRYSYELHFGTFNSAMKVLHKCDNPSCVNPQHLRLGTQADNVADMDLKGRRGAARGERHGSASLTLEQAQAIRADNRPHKEIAADYPIGKSGVKAIKAGRTWRHA